MLPDLNNIIKSFGGKLLPFNWAKLVWALKRETWRSARVPLMGLRREWHTTPQAGGLLAFRSLWILPWFALLLFLSASSAWKARSKAPGQISLLMLYGLHSQLQQIPILLGQLRYARHARKQPAQIEYKEEEAST